MLFVNFQRERKRKQKQLANTAAKQNLAEDNQFPQSRVTLITYHHRIC